MSETKTLKYTVIKSKDQYNRYCEILEELVTVYGEQDQEEIELLSLLIDKWDEEHNSFYDKDPISLLKALMDEHKLKSKDLINILDLSKATVSKILNYHKGLSKSTIRKLSEYFNVSQEAFNRPYKLKNEVNRKHGDI
ncbi:MAG: helix-turn-helix domain-containing protein [Bacteroidales bacterium]|nr:helix-turn-helix domain-containing protein [Bacteroidales bacterium]